MDRKTRNLRPGEEKKHFDMLNFCFQPWGDEEKWKRHYEQPNFRATQNVVVVEENNEWIGGGTAWFRDAFVRNSKKTKVYAAGDGYVHPNHRGKGVYSTFMKSLNELARKRGASLGFGFISLYETPFIALPKYGFVDAFYPLTYVQILNPNKFLDFVFAQLKEVYLPQRFEKLTLKLTISFKVLKRNQEITRIFQVTKGNLCEVNNAVGNKAKTDLSIKADIGTMLKIFRLFYLKKKTLPLIALSNFACGRLRIRFSIRFVKMMLRI